jgi:4-amino-4-deoxy-L-arabinose transferase-like glycosyltransferase
MAPDIRRAVPVLALAVVLGFVARIAWSAWTAPVPPWLSDADYYNATALSIARGQGFSVVFDATRGWLPGGDATAFWPPGFSGYLALSYRLFGEHLWVARSANILVGALTVVPVYFIGRRLYGESSARVAAVLAAVMPSLVFWTPVLLSDTLFTFLFALAMALLLYGFDDSTGPEVTSRGLQVVLTGLTIGLAAMVRGQSVVLIPLALLWWVISGVSVRRATAATITVAVSALVVILPWTVRNARTFGSPVVLSTNFGYNLRVGHAPYSTGRYIVPQDIWDLDPGITFKDRELLLNDTGQHRALQYARTHLRHEVRLSLEKIEWLWRPDSDVLTHVSSYGRTPLPSGAWEPLRLTLDSTYIAVLILALVSMLRVSALGRAVLFPIVLAGLWTAVHVVFFGEPRYHLPILAAIIPMAATTLVWLAEQVWAFTRTLLSSGEVERAT